MYSCYFTFVSSLHGPILQQDLCDDILVDIPQNHFFSACNGEGKYLFISWKNLTLFSHTGAYCHFFSRAVNIFIMLYQNTDFCILDFAFLNQTYLNNAFEI